MIVQGMDRDGVAIRYCEEGLRDAAQTLVFVNSLGTDVRIWLDVARVFGQTMRILRYDKRGHGISDAPPAPYSLDDHVDDLIALLDETGTGQAVIVGVSVGGQIAQGLALRAPERVSALVLCDTAAKIGTAEAWDERIDAIERNGIEAIADGIMERWFSRAYREGSPVELRLWRNLLVRTPVEGYLGTCAALRDADLRDQVGNIAVPTLCVCGDEDGATPPDVVRELADMIPGASYLEIARAGHLPCIEQPAILSNAISSFLSEKSVG
ncbi:MAG: 3-oxoadipate enol-lactonase [Alphaproteobacteria bacterium]|nr:3-oxoadipate enol-lactonase [Alphaproteobacteria bacterium]